MERYDRTRTLIEGDPLLAHEIVQEVERDAARMEGDGIVILDEPHEELVMVQVRETAQGSLFYLGEALATICRVRWDGATGLGLVLGGDRCLAYELAVIDASFSGSSGMARAARWESHLQQEAARVLMREDRVAYESMQTKVDFSTMGGQA